MDLSLYLLVNMRLYLLPSWMAHVSQLLGVIVWGKEVNALLVEISSNNDSHCLALIGNQFERGCHLIGDNCLIFPANTLMQDSTRFD